MGDNSFAPYVVKAGYGQFVVLNIANPPKMVRIFNQPIYPFGSDGDTRDLLKTAGWSEADIRASLLKGEIRNKLLAHEILILASDVDLLQFNSNQLAFLTASGITIGTQVGIPQQLFVWNQDIHLDGTVDGVNTVFTIPSGVFIQTGYYTIVVYLNGVKQNLNDDFTISASTIAGYDTVTFAVAPETIIPPTDVVTADFWQSN